MKNKIKHSLIAAQSVVLLLFSSFSTSAEVRLPDGMAAGLPERLTILDSEGNNVDSNTGEYFFEVENMMPHEEYSKNVQIINLREDKAYHIWFYAEPVSQNGDLDLLNECTSVLSLDETQIFEGNVNGTGVNQSLQEPLDLGMFSPGDSKQLNFNVKWLPGSLNNDNGEKLVDSDGTHIIRESQASAGKTGEVFFRWVFYAAVDETYVPPKTGVLYMDSWIYICILTGLLTAVLVMLVVIRKRKSTGTP